MCQDTIDDLIEGVRDALIRWRDFHYNPETWVDNWLSDSSATDEYEDSGGIVENGYYTFDWQGEAVNVWAEQILDTEAVYWCKNCGAITWDEETCDCEEPDLQELGNDETEVLTRWLIDLDETPPEDILYDTLLTVGYEVYYAALSMLIDPVRADIDQALDGIDNAATPADRLLEAMMASHISHVNGNILEDYGGMTDDDYKELQDLAQYGLSECFSPEEIAEYMGEEIVGG